MANNLQRIIDWDSIEAEYRAGQIPLAEIARQHEITPAAITMRAKRHNWPRDLSKKVRQAVNAKLVNSAVNVNKTPSGATDDEIVEAAAERGRLVVEGHLAKAQFLKDMADKIGEGLKAHLENRDPGFELFVAKGDGPASVLRTLTDVAEKIANLERKALNLDEHDINQTQILIMVD